MIIQISSANDDRASECSSTASSKPPMYPLTPTGTMRNGYTAIGMKQRELRTKLHKTRYVQSQRQTNSSPTMFDSPSSRRTPLSSPHPNMPTRTVESNGQKRNNDDDENESIFSELRMSSIPNCQNDARLPPPVPLNTTNKIPETRANGTKNSSMPTTLSIEERRVKESIERLDRQLQDVQMRTRSTSGTRTQKNQKR